MCDVAYLCQVEALERETLAQVALIPHLDEQARKQVPSVADVRAEFDGWLLSEPVEQRMTPADVEQATLHRLMLGER